MTNRGMLPGAIAGVASRAGSFGGEVGCDFSTKADGSPVAVDSGQTWTLANNSATGSAPIISSGRLTFAPSAAPAAAYTQTQLKGAGTRIGARFRLGTKTTANGGACLIFWAAAITGPPIVVPDSPCHFVTTHTGWTYGVWSGGSMTAVKSGTYATALTDDTDYTAEVVIDRKTSTAYISLPDGSRASCSHALIGSVAGTWACWESYKGATTDAIASFDLAWADSVRTDQVLTAKTLGDLHRNYGMQHAPASAATYAAPGSLASIDATNLKLAFTPAGTKVLVTIQLFLESSTGFYLVRPFTTNGVGGQTGVVVNGAIVPGTYTYTSVLSGLTAGVPDVLVPQHFAATGSVTAKADGPNGKICAISISDIA